jgi:O-antigen/teichoic acid export membrane protein
VSRAEITHSVTRGTFYLAIEKAAALVSGVAYFALLLRWLGPTKYGIITLALSFAGLATTATGNFEMFLERFAAEYHAHGRNATLRRAHLLVLAVKLALGALAAALVVALAEPLARSFQSPEQAALLPILAVFVAADGFSTTGRSTLMGLQEYRWVTGIALLFHVAKTVTVGALWFSRQGLVELAAAITLLSLAQGLLSTAVPLWMLRGARDRDSAVPMPGVRNLFRGVVRYCMPLLGARITFLSGQNLGKVVLGKIFTAADLGVFAFAYQTVERFVELAYALPAAMLPALTRLAAGGDAERLRVMFDRAHRIGQVVACALSFGLVVFGREITLLVGSALFERAIPLLQVMALVPIARTAQQPLTMLFQAMKRTEVVFHLAVLKFATELLGYLTVVPWAGVMGAGVANLAGAVVSYAASMTRLARILPAGTGERLASVGRSLSLFLPLIGAGLVADAVLPPLPSLVLRLALVPAAAAGTLALGLVNRYDLDRLSSFPLGSAWMRRVRDAGMAVVLRLARTVEPRTP